MGLVTVMIMSYVTVRYNKVLVLYVTCFAIAVLPVCALSPEFGMGILTTPQTEG